MTVFITQGWMRVAATMPGPELAAYGWNVREPRDKGDKRRRDGRTVQVRVRAAVRTNQAACRQKRQFLGTGSRPKNPCRVRNAGGFLRLRRSRGLFGPAGSCDP